MIRKCTAVFLAFFLALPALLLPGCGSSEGAPAEETTPSETDAAESEPADSEPEEAAVRPSAADEPLTEDDASSPDTTAPGSAAFSADPARFPITLADTDQFAFSVQSSAYDPLQGYNWTVSMENRSEEKLLFSLDKVSIDDVMCDPYWAETVAPGKKAVTTVSWLPYSLEETGLSDATKVEFVLTVFNDDDYTAPAVFREPFAIYPRGEAAAASHVREAQDTDVVLASNDSCRITLTGIDADGPWGYTAFLYLENLTDEDLIFSAENVSVNGTMADPYWAASVAAGKRSCSAMIWGRTALEEKEIADVTEIEIPFLVYGEDNYGDLKAEETVTITPGSP